MSLFDRVETPTLLLDETKVKRNIHRMAEKARAEGIRFRPHFKTHQSVQIGEWFRAEGVQVITVSSLEMATYFARAGWNDITVAFPVNLRQMNLINELAAQIHLGLLVESVEAVESLAHGLRSPVDVWIKVDTGYHRAGLAWDQPAAVLAVARAAQHSTLLHLRGLLTHSSKTYTIAPRDEIVRIHQEGTARVNTLRSQLTAAGVTGLEISVGDTPGCTLTPTFGAVEEIRPGNFVFYDAEQWLFGSCAFEDVAVAVACPVVAKHPERDEVLIYGGAVHLSKDFVEHDGAVKYALVAFPQGDGWGQPLPGAYAARLSQEHGVLHMPAAYMDQIHVGDLLIVFPAHICLTVQALRTYLTLDGERIETLNS